MDFWNWDIRIQSALISGLISFVSLYITTRQNKNRDKVARKNILLDNFKKDFLSVQQEAIRIWYTEPNLRDNRNNQLLQSNLSSLLKDYTSEEFKAFYKIILHQTSSQLAIECRRCFLLDIESVFEESKETHLTEMVDKIFQSLNIR